MKKVPLSKVKMFKIQNRKGYACVCSSHLTEGRTPYQAYLRMQKALKRTGSVLTEIDAAKAKKLVKNL